MNNATQQGVAGQPAKAPKAKNRAGLLLATALIGAVGAVLNRHFDVPEDESDLILQALEKLAKHLFD